MRNLVLKMVTEGVLTSENANKMLAMKKGVDPVWRALSKGLIDEKKLARFYEKEGYPVIYDEGRGPMSDDFFTRFFTPDVIARHLAVPISFKKESRDIIVGFINAALIPQIKENILKIFPEFNTTFFHIPYSIFKKIAAKHFLFDIDKYTSVMIQMEVSGEMHSDKVVSVSSVRKKLREAAEQVYMLEIDAQGSVVFKEESMTSRFPLKSLPIFKEGFERGYMEIIPGDNLNSLSHTEKILLFTNVGIKNDDKIMILAADEEKKTFVLLLNPKVPKDQIDFLLR
ncbi:MAG TPA: hypothetical protein PLD55_08390 [bacterium]|jgi:hypothetical protein|nr:hypothetical protein [bacterium]MDX9806446.1 hypothetical protein [bacterium]HNZ53851.1 hypothetical protein [bacterium]HOG43829.1 hypothetical protein [bacterium]HPG35351.1 hypothetical protein [bacterium]